MHVFTGADSTSTFVGKGKKDFEIFPYSARYEHAFERLGTSSNVTESLFECLKEFVCRLQGQSCSNINQARDRIFCSKSFNENKLALCRDALLQHTYRAKYQTAIDRRALEQFMNASTPHERGWKIFSNEISIRWVTRSQAPTELMKHLACKCKRTHCNTNQCFCHCTRVSSTELCCCVSYNNTSNTSTENELLSEVTNAEDEEDEA